MAKWFGKIGYGFYEEVEPGLYENRIVEREYYGDITSDRRSRQIVSDSVNDSINLSSILSIVSDPFADHNCSNILYAEIRGVKWKITNIDLQYPRLIMNVGGIYNNGDSIRTSE